MKQKDIYWADLNPIKGKEQGGRRPVVIVSGPSMNEHFGVFIVCPVSTKIKNYSGCVQLKKNRMNRLKQDSEIITFQIRTVSRERLREKIGAISDEELRKVFEGLSDILTY